MIGTRSTIAVLVVIVAIGGLFSGYKINKNNVEAETKQISVSNSSIVKSYANFSKEKDNNSKINDLKNLIIDSKNYKNSSKTYAEVTKNYESKISNIRKYFTNNYDKNLADNSVDSDNKVVLSKQTKNLNLLSVTIKSEKDTTLSNSKSYDNYQSKITSAIDVNTSKIQVIDAIIAKAKKDSDAKIAAVKAITDKTNKYLDAKTTEVDKDELNTKTVSGSTSKSSNNSINNSSPAKVIATKSTTTKTVAKASVSTAKKYKIIGGKSINVNDSWRSYTQDGVTSYYDEMTGEHWNTSGNTWTDSDLGGYK